jgi:Rieske Fe-S protein
MDRREFVGVAAAGWLGACASLVTTTVTPVDGMLRLPLRNHPNLDRPGGYLKVQPADTDMVLYVLELGPGEYAAVSPICKHLGCTVGIDGAQLLCPCHGSMYGRDGAVLRGPTQAPLDRFPVELSPDGVLVISLQGPRG